MSGKVFVWTIKLAITFCTQRTVQIWRKIEKKYTKNLEWVHFFEQIEIINSSKMSSLGLEWKIKECFYWKKLIKTIVKPRQAQLSLDPWIWWILCSPSPKQTSWRHLYITNIPHSPSPGRRTSGPEWSLPCRCGEHSSQSSPPTRPPCGRSDTWRRTACCSSDSSARWSRSSPASVPGPLPSVAWTPLWLIFVNIC